MDVHMCENMFLMKQNKWPAIVSDVYHGLLN